MRLAPKTTKRLPSALLAAALLIGPSALAATSPSDVSSAVRYGAAAPLGTPLEDLSDSDDATQTIASAFPINFFGAVSDHLCVTTNGGLYPVSGDTSCSDDYDESVADLAISSRAPMIAALAGDLDLGEDDDIVDDGFGTAGEIYAGTTTIDGADAMTLTWYRVPMYDDENDRTLSNTFQIVLIKGSTGDDTAGWDFTIEYNYGTLTDGEDGYDAGDPSSGCSSGEDVCRWGIGWASYHAAIDIASISVAGGVATITTAAPHALTGTGSSIRLKLPDDDGSAALDGERVTAT
ncbi:MAG: nidogen-like domain-containing protein, partial [Planctomycetota bacterium]